MRDEGKLCREGAAEDFFHAVARVAFAEAGHWRINGDDEGVVASFFCPVDGVLGDFAAADKIKLEPSRAFRGCTDVFELMAGDGGERVDRASFAGGRSRGTFAAMRAGIHHAGIADGRKNRGEGKIEREDARANVTFGNGDGPARTEDNVIKDAAIFAEGDFAVGAAVEVIEDDAREAAFGADAEVVDVDDGRRKSGWHAERLFLGRGRVSTGKQLARSSGSQKKKQILRSAQDDHSLCSLD